jgi:tRNA threonylcarbamoyladenosine biosynthesis protein TsaE
MPLASRPARRDSTAVQLRIASPEDMRRLGERLGHVAQPGDRFLLEGPLGAGKTTFVQGLARGLSVKADVSSPSFVIEHQYAGRLQLFHIDLYRLDGIEAELQQSLEEDLYGDGVAAVEWAERLPAELRRDATLLRFHVDGEDAPDGDDSATRTVTLQAARDELAAAARGR